MGLSCSGDEFNRRVDMAFVDRVNTVRVVDDLLRFDQDFPAHVKGLCDLLQAARMAGITLSLEKFKFEEPKAAWVGYEIQHEEFTPKQHHGTPIFHGTRGTTSWILGGRCRRKRTASPTTQFPEPLYLDRRS
jgi:hypothetical protein